MFNRMREFKARMKRPLGANGAPKLSSPPPSLATPAHAERPMMAKRERETAPPPASRRQGVVSMRRGRCHGRNVWDLTLTTLCPKVAPGAEIRPTFLEIRSRPSSANRERCFCQVRPEFARFCPIARCWPPLDKHRPELAYVGGMWPSFGQCRPDNFDGTCGPPLIPRSNFGATSGRFQGHLGLLARFFVGNSRDSSGTGRLSAIIGRSRAAVIITLSGMTAEHSPAFWASLLRAACG